MLFHDIDFIDEKQNPVSNLSAFPAVRARLLLLAAQRRGGGLDLVVADTLKGYFVEKGLLIFGVQGDLRELTTSSFWTA